MKRRLIGATVLVSLAVIFLPMLLEHQPAGVKPEPMRPIPEEPQTTFDGTPLESVTPVPARPVPSSLAQKGAVEPSQSVVVQPQVPAPSVGVSKPEPAAMAASEPEPAVVVPAPAPRPAREALAPKPSSGGGERPRPEGQSKPVLANRPKPALEPKPVVVSKPTPKPKSTAGPKSEPKPTTVAKAKPPVSPPPRQWVIQVASLSSYEGALGLVKKLRGAGLETLDPSLAWVKGKRFYRVQVGPLPSRKAAEAHQELVRRIAGSRGKVMRYP